MPMIFVECEDGHVREAMRPLAMWPDTPPCPACEKPTKQAFLPSYMNGQPPVDPVVVYQDAHGQIFVPPDTECLSTARYDKLGHTRIELRGWAHVRRFEQYMDRTERSKIERRIERQQEAHEAAVKERHSEIRRGIEQGFDIPVTDAQGRVVGTQKVRLTEYGKDIMRAAMARTDGKGPKAYDAGCHFEAYSQDRSNRAPDPRRRGQ